MAMSVQHKAPPLKEARRAKVLSVDPAGIDRSDLDGAHDRPGVFAALRSFENRGLSPAEFAARTIALLAIPDARDAEEVKAFCIRHFTGLPGGIARTPEPADLAAADAALDHRFSFYGETHQLPPRIDWDHNPGTEHWGYDLNRFTFLYTLSDAFVRTGNRKYADEAIRLILAWIEDTDICDTFIPGSDPDVWIHSCKRRYVWLSHLEPAIHLVVWGHTLAALLPRLPDLVSAGDFLRIVKSVYDHLTWLEVIMPEGGHGNGLVAGASCQLQALAFFPVFRDGARLAATALERLTATMSRQVLPDGVQHELTPHYHYCVLKDLLNVLGVEPLLPAPVPSSLREIARRMLRYVRQTITPDGRQVAFNDSDAGLGYWVLEGLAQPVARELLKDEWDDELTSACYPYGGVMILRQGSRRGRDELYLAFDGGPFGNVHQHEDKLSFWLSAYGRPFIVDPGRHLYDYGEGSFYRYLVTTKAHSTIRIDDRDQNSQADRTKYVSWDPLPLRWEQAADGRITAAATYDLGYGPDLIPVRHTRTIEFRPDPGFWIVTDDIAGEGLHDIESRFQFAPGDLALEGTLARTTYADANLALLWRRGEWEESCVEKGQESPRAGWHSENLNRIEPAPALALHRRRSALPFRSVILLFPYRGADLPDRLPLTAAELDQWAPRTIERDGTSDAAPFTRGRTPR